MVNIIKGQCCSVHCKKIPIIVHTNLIIVEAKECLNIIKGRCSVLPFIRRIHPGAEKMERDAPSIPIRMQTSGRNKFEVMCQEADLWAQQWRGMWLGQKWCMDMVAAELLQRWHCRGWPVELLQ
jgi:hypothetical protein